MNRACRSVVITGASNGLGRALAAAYAAPDRIMLLVGRDATRLNEAAQHCRSRGAIVEIAQVDVRDADRLAAAILAFDRRHPVDLVIANAGAEGSLGPGRSAESVESASAQLRINLEGAINTVTPLIEPMRQRKSGSIALIASLAGFAPVPDKPSYSASKAGLIGWGEALIPWLKPDGISVSIACPGFIATGFKDHHQGGRPLEVSADEAAARIVRGIARGKAIIAFPWQLNLLIRLGAIAPALRRAVMARFFRSSVDLQPR